MVLFIGIAAVMAAGPASAQNIRTYSAPDATSACPYAVTIDGASVPIEKLGEYQGAYYVRMELKPDAHVRARVALRFSVPCFFTLKPERFRTNVKSKGQSIEFDIDRPGPRVITAVAGSREMWPLILLVDRWKDTPPPSGNVYQVSDYVSGAGVQTAGIQKALDECPGKGGGTVVFAPGVYVTGSIFIRDNTRVVLSPGTLIRGSTDLNDYPVNKAPDSNAPGSGTSALVNFRNCKNSSVSGPGVIDGSGLVIRNEYGKHIRALLVIGSENVAIEDVVLRNSPSWTCHLFNSKNVRIDGLKVLADWAIGNTDGIDADCSQDVTISNYFAFCGDDGLAIKTTTTAGPSKNIKMSDSVVMTHKTAFKIGTETLRDISNVLIENCDAVSTGRGLGLYLLDGAEVSDITYRNVRLDLMEYPGERYGGSPFSASIGQRTGIGVMDGVTFENVTAQAPWYSDFSGQPSSPISNVTFRNCALAMANRCIKTEKLPVFNLKNCKGFAWQDCTLEWKTPMLCLWDGLVKTESSEKIETDGLNEVKPEAPK